MDLISSWTEITGKSHDCSLGGKNHGKRQWQINSLLWYSQENYMDMSLNSPGAEFSSGGLYVTQKQQRCFPGVPG